MLLGYARISTDDKGQTIQTQTNQMLERGYNVAMYFVDVGISGSKAPLERDGMSRLLSVAKPGDTIVVSTQDRLSRDVDHTRALIRSLNKKGVIVLSLREGELDMTTTDGSTMITMNAMFAERERNIIRERVNKGMRNAQVNGTKSGKPIGRPKNTIHSERIQELFISGMKKAFIARELGVSRPTVDKALKA
ncbi:recombinase family protein [Enterobacter pseudoroggenkampii]|uniref:recombinase family protein n=1 Tax=Enterobacter pseudoroggenkampii TaxID=2996112 RepID=UPI0022653CC2|nr:recombinase family protein [Enterobacter pseudoroggenkampii]MCX8289105.1 recombinase family protein [Enterobacter pseudoroggenkampii]